VGAQPEIQQQAKQHSGFDKEWKSALITDISSFRNCSVKRSESGCTILDSGGAERGEIQYDVETHERLDFDRCVVVGRDFYQSDAGRKYYILVVRLTGMENEYTRVGAGWIRGDDVARQDVQALIV
jgi:hypothetical protein